jgi:hypothetical protein
MRILARTATMTAALIGALTFSQAPEFAQQYQQRLGGALDELRIIVADFDRDATLAGIDRPQALAIYDGASEPFLRNRGQSMRRTLTRFETIGRQSADMARTSPFAKPFALLRNADDMILTNAWRDFQPGVPVTPAGLLWAATGAGLGWLLVGGARMLLRLRRHRPVPASQLT